MRTNVWINARFLGRPVTGVERVAHEVIGALSKRLDDSGTWTAPDGTRLTFRLMTPASSVVESPWKNLEVRRFGWGGGHLWEQTGLLAGTRGEWLISLCNTGPILKRNHLLFLHDAQPFAIPQNFNWKFRLWYKVLFSLGGRWARAVLTNSQFSRDELVRWAGLSADRITPMVLGTDHVMRLPPDLEIIRKHGLGKGTFLFAVSSVNPNKNFSAVVRALETMGKQAPMCVIAGQRCDKVFQKTNLQDGDRVIHVGYVSDAELYALYAHAQCLIYPSFYEGFGLPPVEAMALGCPAIVSRTSSLPEVCGDAALYCDPENPASIVEGILRLRDEPGLREQLVSRARSRVQGYTWGRSAETLMTTLVGAMHSGTTVRP